MVRGTIVPEHELRRERHGDTGRQIPDRFTHRGTEVDRLRGRLARERARESERAREKERYEKE